MREIDNFIEEKIKNGYFPGCVILIGNKSKNIFHRAYGLSELTPSRREMTKDSIFDIASLTKPIATATGILLLVEAGEIGFQDRVGSILSELKDTANKNKTIFELLTHTSGIPAWYPLYLYSRDEKEIIRFIGNMEVGKPIYSCLDYILLGKVVERIIGESLKAFAEKNIFKPLGMKDTFFCPGQELRTRIAATEKGNRHERVLSKKYVDKPFGWRKKTIIGEAHDGNSFYGFGGVSGNAGLFSTAADLAIFARILLNGGNETISSRIVDALLIEKVNIDGEKRSMGFVIGGDDLDGLSQKTVWHTGFTGCVFWVDTVKEIFIIFLINAVHPDVKPNIIASIRTQIINHCLKVAM